MSGRDRDQKGSIMKIYLSWYTASSKNIGVLKNTVAFVTTPSDSSVTQDVITTGVHLLHCHCGNGLVPIGFTWLLRGGSAEKWSRKRQSIGRDHNYARQ